MQHRKFSIKHIATQAAVSPATVDRVINNRPGVGTYTKQRVQNAIIELEEYAAKVNFSCKQLYVDVVMNTEHCYSSLVQEAFIRTLHSMKNFNINPRFHFFQNESPSSLANQISRIIDNGTQGIIINANNEYPLKESIEYALSKDIPTVTFGTDIPYSKRVQYIGANNFSDGQTAAYFIGQWLKSKHTKVLISTSMPNFLNKAEREIGFRQYLQQKFPDLHIDILLHKDNSYKETFNSVNKYLKNDGNACALYSIGGCNKGILSAYKKHAKPIKLFITHDLSHSNKLLMEDNKIDVVLDRNIDVDAHNAFLSILRFHKLIKHETAYIPSSTGVITPCNLSPS
ncbi:MAG: LacI family DNA-binding transcriptional regulator [Arenicella sp.]